MRLKFNLATKEVLLDENESSTLNANDVMWHTLSVVPIGTQANDELKVVYQKDGNTVTVSNETLIFNNGDGSYQALIPDSVIKDSGTWTLQLLVYRSTVNGGKYQRCASNPFAFTVERGLYTSSNVEITKADVATLYAGAVSAKISAEESKTSAEKSAQTAKTSQQNASEYATSANNAKNDAESARDLAISAKNYAENAAKNTATEISREINNKIENGDFDGKSAYEVWLESGRTGTEEDFLKSLKGEQGVKGDTGAPFAISKVYSSVVAMNAGFATDGVAEGAFVIINTDDENDTDNARLYVKGKSSYQYLTDMSGARGIQGPKGERGIQGIQGLQGATGEQGKSAYEVWLSQGNTGTEADFINSLKGERGETGEQGYFAIVRLI